MQSTDTKYNAESHTECAEGAQQDVCFSAYRAELPPASVSITAFAFPGGRPSSTSTTSRSITCNYASIPHGAPDPFQTNNHPRLDESIQELNMNDNTTIPEQTPLHDGIKGMASEDGNAIWIERTAREMAEREILELASLPEKAPEPIIEIGIDGGITFCNAAASREFQGILVQGLEHPALGRVFPIIDRMVVSGETETVREIIINGKTWEQRFLHYAPAQRIRIFNRDITRMRLLELDVKQLLGTLKRERTDNSRMIDGLSCEMRSELTVLAGYVSLLAEMTSDATDIKAAEILSLIQSVIDRLDLQMLTFTEGYEALSSIRTTPNSDAAFGA